MKNAGAGKGHHSAVSRHVKRIDYAGSVSYWLPHGRGYAKYHSVDEDYFGHWNDQGEACSFTREELQAVHRRLLDSPSYRVDRFRNISPWWDLQNLGDMIDKLPSVVEVIYRERSCRFGSA